MEKKEKERKKKFREASQSLELMLPHDGIERYMPAASSPSSFMRHNQDAPLSLPYADDPRQPF